MKYIKKTVGKLTNNKANGHYREMAWLPFQKYSRSNFESRNVCVKMLNTIESKLLIVWRSRNLTFEGKSLIIKTFGISQLVYGLQVVEIKDAWM